MTAKDLFEQVLKTGFHHREAAAIELRFANQPLIF